MDENPKDNYELFAQRLSDLHKAEGMLGNTRSRFNGDMPTVLLKKLTYVCDFLGVKRNEFIYAATSKQLEEEVDIIMDKVVRVRRGESLL